MRHPVEFFIHWDVIGFVFQEHNSDNQKEVKRILAEHPENEHHHIIKGDRLLSILAPLRAFGDFKFKWDRSTIEDTLGAILGEHACPPNYKTPPYLTARPEVTYHRLSPRDKFLVIGSDGLWDMMTPMQVTIQLESTGCPRNKAILHFSMYQCCN